jgi:serine protease inhibitor ecotin
MPKIQKCPSMEMSFTSIIAFLARKLDDEELQLAIVVARLIWLRCNNMVFGGKFMSPVQILETAVSQMESFKRPKKVGE